MKDEDAVLIGKRLRHFRKTRKLTQNDAQTALGISGLKKYESGKHTPSYRILKLLKSFYDVSYDELLLPNSPAMTNGFTEHDISLDEKINTMYETGKYSLYHRGNKYCTRIYLEQDYIVIRVSTIDNSFDSIKKIKQHKLRALAPAQLKTVIATMKAQVKG